ncbi:Prenyltransferase and squalene oxidase repeat-containing protein [Streptomyces sp. 1222.5]|uniref:prenyltransferase/squalene oxidase repeat-containing protein n=1 Tax=unclassified Streptomyces TaxID=2593676 RepID=UPI00089B6CFD|nr:MULTISPECIES: prenyltransferase/squalene oxidase repeat-containing protein [unclassified Streptomyces]PKW07531.1 prenyltransferase/squalene oxidase-like repeat protein [Streptomyces sp. 5112.2]SEC86438.1 Prenyltransferase and squalene oxidase repeat-containing protein [Streptomyces sp. 1222.5]
MNVRRSAAALAAIGVLAAAAPATAADASPSPKVAVPDGLYGKADPTYDGVWRQSLTLLAQRTLGYRPTPKAVDWLTGQQCANGSFAAFRAAPGKACDDKTQVDTNSTAAAVQALAAVGGHDRETRKALVWLTTVQNKDGGWGYTPGGPSDTNSTSVVIGAFAAVGQDVAKLHNRSRTPYDLLAAQAVPCDQDGGGALAYQPDKKGKLLANADATAAGLLGSLGKGFAAEVGKAPAKDDCVKAAHPTPAQLADNAGAYLASAVAETGHLKSTLPGAKDQPDFGNTADAVVALAADGRTDRAKKVYAWLEKNATQWAAQSGPAAYAQLILAAHAVGAQPDDFGGTSLVRSLNAQGPAPQAEKAAGKKAEASDDDSNTGVWWIVGVGLVAGIGIGFLLSGRKKNRP